MSGSGQFESRPVLVFDGDCAFCRMWIEYWQALTGDRVEYVSYQTGARRFPDVAVNDFKKAVHLFKDGKTYTGAEAVFQLAATLPERAWQLWLFYRVPGFAALAGWAYGFVAAHRNAGFRITRLFWGKRVPPPQYTVASRYFLRALAFIYMIAFISFGRQVRGLIGEQGIQPVTEFLGEVSKRYGSSGFWLVPSLFWWANSEFALLSIVWGGAVLAFVAAIGRPHTAGQRAAFVVIFIYYLSVVNGGQIFMGYQWDYLLLEAGFLAIFLKPVRTRIWLFQWLLFRLVFESGAVKLLSHDPSWRNLTALAVHYQTQPLPTPLAWYMMQLPLG
ncbi:MAG TPA: lipase maturation factor family protein, partial [Bryobacteraceae bacterium]|nr:lipase maturation factor family protein [Bryobacteraceae bacterium]